MEPSQSTAYFQNAFQQGILGMKILLNPPGETVTWVEMRESDAPMRDFFVLVEEQAIGSGIHIDRNTVLQKKIAKHVRHNREDCD